MTTDPIAVVEQYLAVVADLDASPDDLDAFVHPDARFTERPNLVAPGGRRRDAACAAPPSCTAARCSSENRLDVHEHVVAGERVVTRATWTGVLADRRRAGPRRHRDARRVLHGLHGARRADPRAGQLRLLPPGRGARRRGLTFPYRRYLIPTV